MAGDTEVMKRIERGAGLVGSHLCPLAARPTSRPHLRGPFQWIPIFLILILSGCASQETRVPVPVSCLREAPPAMPQTLTEAEILAMDEYRATIISWSERLLLKAYGAKADALLQSCR